MSKAEYTEEQLSDMREDAFVNIKEACMRLNEVSEFYITQDEKNKI